jgi:hypothetical protein
LSFPVSHKKRFEARKTGGLVHFISGEGKVISVYPRALNISCGQGLLLSLIEDMTQMTALSLHVPLYFGTPGRGAQAGALVQCEKGRLRLNGLCIDFAGGTPWEGSLIPGSVRDFSLSKMAMFRQALLQQGKRGGLLGLIQPSEEKNPFVEKAAGILRRILQQTPYGAYMNGLSQLVGLGPGLTPSGDDFIAGLLLGEEILSLLTVPQGKIHSGPIHAVIPLKINKGELWHGLTATNDGGRTLLYQTLLGCFPNYLISVAKNLGKAQAMADTADAVRRAVSHGETSGTDALVGLWFYLNACANAYEYEKIRGKKRRP